MMLTRSLTRPAVGSRATPFRASPVVTRPAVAVRAKTAEADVKSKKEEKKQEEDEFEDGPEVLPSTAQVETLLNALCNETEIAELNLKMGTFSLRVKRSMTGHHHAPAHASHAAPAAAAAPAPVAAAPAPEPVIVEESVDESLVQVKAPKVGIFRRGKYAGGKRVGKGNAVNESDKVRKGQPIGFIEQLGTHIQVEASIAGELVKFHVEDGRAVEYGQLIAEVAPYFGGHIIGDSKHA